MAYIFLDESGDLGFSKKSSKWFLFTIVLTNDHRSLEKVIKKIHRKLSKKYKRVAELHAYHSQSSIKIKVLEQIAKLKDVKVLCTILNKHKVYIDLKNQKNYLYNYTANILLDRLHKTNVINKSESIYLFIDQKDTNKNLRENFEKYLKSNLSKWGNKQINIKIKPSHTEKCLQAVDFISWAIFRKYELDQDEYYKIIKEKIIGEKLLFP